MYHLLIDTCVWMNLGKKHHELRRKLSDLVDQGKVKLIVPQTIIDEWERNKTKVVDDMAGNVPYRVKEAKSLIRHLPGNKAEEYEEILKWLAANQSAIESPFLEEVEAIDKLLAHSSNIYIPIEDRVKLVAVDHALEKKAPFHKRSSMADALILFSTIDYISDNPLTHCFFVSDDTTDFANPDKDNKGQIHKDLKELLENHNIEFFNNIGEALNKIKEQLVSEAEIAEIEAEQLFETIRQSPVLEAIFTDQFSESRQRMLEVLQNSVQSPSFQSYLDTAKLMGERAADVLLAQEQTWRTVARYAADIERTHRQSLLEMAEIVSERLSENQFDLEKMMGPTLKTLEYGVNQVRKQLIYYVGLSDKTVTLHRRSCRYYASRTADETKNGYWSPVIKDEHIDRKVRCCKVCLPNLQQESDPDNQ